MAIYIFPFSVCAVLAVLYQLKLVRLNRTFYGIALIGIGLFAGLRFETGQDWPAYESFFQRIDLSQNLFEPYFNERIEQPQFEIGYYLLNYAIKYLGGTYSIVLLLASLFCVYAVYRFTYRFSVNRFYILTIYFSFSFLVLHFAQVRQSIAIAFILIGIDHYLRHRKILIGLAICLTGLFFQYSAIVYIILFLAAVGWTAIKRKKLLWAVSLCLVVLSTLYAITRFLDVYSLLTLIATESAAEKIDIYKGTQEASGIGLRIFAGYLLLLACYFANYSRHLKNDEALIIVYAIFSILLTTALIVIFPESYVMYSRAYVMACILQGCAAALILASTKGWLHRCVFVGTIAMAMVYYLRILTLYEDQYVPYRAIVALAGL